MPTFVLTKQFVNSYVYPSLDQVNKPYLVPILRKLWKSEATGSSPTNTESPHLPENVVKSDMVCAIIHDNGYNHLEQTGKVIQTKGTGQRRETS